MIVTECKSYGGKCPCVACSNEKCEAWLGDCDTEKLCEKAKEYCESVHKEEVAE